NPRPASVYYAVDGVAGTSLTQEQRGMTAPGGTTYNPKSATVSLGLHWLYVYATAADNGTGFGYPGGNSPDISNLAAYPFLVVPFPTSTSVTSDVNPQTAGSNVTFTATVTSSYTGDPTGTVYFYDGTTLMGTGLVQNSSGTYTAIYSTLDLTVGSHPIKAIYAGDTAFASSTGSLPTPEQITTPVVGSLTVMSGDGQSANVGTAFANPIVVKVLDGGAPPSGVAGVSVSFTGTGLTFAPSATATTDANGQVSVTVTPTQAGTLTGTATSNGKSVNFTLTATKITPTVTLTSSANPSTTGQSVTFTATVSDNATGRVAFKDNGNVFTACATQSITSGKATCTLTTLMAGTHPITATYTTDNSAVYNDATGTLTPTPNQVVSGAVATVSIVSGGGQSGVTGTALANPVVVKAVDSNGNPVPGVAVTLTGTGFTYTPNPATTGPDGTVSITVTPTGTGQQTVTVTAGGKTTTFSFTGTAPVTPGFTVGVTTSASATIPASGGTATYTISVASVGGFTGDVKLTATSSPALPGGVVPVLTPDTIKPGETSKMTITLAAATASVRSYSPVAFALLLLPVVLIGKARKLRMTGLLAVVLAFGAVAGMIGCGGGSGSNGGGGGRTPKSYTITVKGTSGSITNTLNTITLTQ
ncbi:MAG: Ig-like domain repeat protein, partial [Acidobacteriaceae bacterium]|nr:Ig-like domain repeat protein [Acidobacteriaceae bacterium]